MLLNCFLFNLIDVATGSSLGSVIVSSILFTTTDIVSHLLISKSFVNYIGLGGINVSIVDGESKLDYSV